MEHAAYHHNRISCAARGGMTPYEIVTGEKPDIRHLRRFGQLAFVQKSDAKRRDGDRNSTTPMEWCTKAEPAIFIGYQGTTWMFMTLRGTGAKIHSKDAEFCRDNRNVDEINPKMFEDNLGCLLYTSPSPRDS